MLVILLVSGSNFALLPIKIELFERVDRKNSFFVLKTLEVIFRSVAITIFPILPTTTFSVNKSPEKVHLF